jgi:hypothetical protein
MKTNRRLNLSIADVVLAPGTLLSSLPVEVGGKFLRTLVTSSMNGSRPGK